MDATPTPSPIVVRDSWGFPLRFAPIIHPHFDAFNSIEQALPVKPRIRVKAGRSVAIGSAAGPTTVQFTPLLRGV